MKLPILALVLAIQTANFQAQTPDTTEASRLLHSAIERVSGGKSDFQNSFEEAKKAAGLFTAALGEGHARVGDAWMVAATAEQYLPNGDAFGSFSKAKNAFSAALGPNDWHALAAEMQCATMLGFRGETKPALQRLRAAAAAYEKLPAAPKKHLMKAFYYLGGFSALAGDVESGLAYHQKNLQLQQVENQESTTLFGMTLSGIAICLQEQNRHRETLPYLERTLAIFEKLFPPDHPNIASAHRNLGLTHNHVFEFDKGIAHLKKAIELFLNKFGPEHKLVADCHQDLGLAYLQIGKIDLAERSFFQCEKALKAPGNQSFFLALPQLQMRFCHLYREQKRFPEALAAADKGLAMLGFSAADSLPNVEANVLDVAVKILREKSHACLDWYAQTRDPKALQTGQQSLRLAFAAINKIRQNLQGDASRESVQRRYSDVFYTAAELENLAPMPDPERFFEISERCKSESLFSGFLAAQGRGLTDLPDSLLQKSAGLKKSLADLDAQIAAASAARDSVKVTAFFGEKFQLHRSLDSLNKQLENEHPRAFRMLFRNETPRTAEAIAQLLPDAQTALLEFFDMDSVLFTFLLTKNGFKHWRLLKPEGYNELAPAFRNIIADRARMRSDYIGLRSDFVEKATQLFDILLRRPLENAPEIRRLIIVPDGVANQIPFEALLRERPAPGSDFADFQYVVKKYAVSYAYSAGLLMEQCARTPSSQNRGTKRGFAAFAPAYDSDLLTPEDTLNTREILPLLRGGDFDLTFARVEAKTISRKMFGQLFSGEQASERFFKNYAGQFSVLHLAMHGFANEQTPELSKLLFAHEPIASPEDGNLLAAEIYGLQLPADLVVLAACNTGFGPFVQGDGTLSLARAFTYAGTRSTLMTLWRIPDKQTSSIMQTFYKNLQNGQAKDIALQNAKIEWLQNARNPEMAHPFFWAGPVLNGNVEPLDLSGARWQLWLCAGLLLLVLALIGLIFFGGKSRIDPRQQMPGLFR